MSSLLTRLARPVALHIKPSTRSFTTLQPLRPTLLATFRPALTSFTPAPSFTPSSILPGADERATAPADLVPTAAVSSHPALAGAAQIRFGPRNTMQGHTRLVQKRRHGWLKRMRSKTGRRILERRKLKGRRNVAW